MIVCVAGNPSIDKLFEVDQLNHGDIHRPDHFVALPGGKGIHVAQVAKALGGEAIVTGILAGHAGRWIVDQLAAEGVDGRFVWGEGETRSSLSVADRQTGRLTEFYEAGSVSNDDEWGHLERLTADLLPLGSWLALAGTMPPGTPDDGFSRMIATAHEAGVPTALGLAVRRPGPDAERAADIVKINVHEARRAARPRDRGVEQVKRAASEIRGEIGGDGHAAVITMGEAGVVAVDPEGRVHRGRLYERGRYPVGSGDALLGGLLAGLDRDDPWPDAIALALGAATANAEIPGAGHLDPNRARALAAGAEITSSADSQPGPGVEHVDLLGVDAEPDHAPLLWTVARGEARHRLDQRSVMGRDHVRVKLLGGSGDQLGGQRPVDDQLVAQRLDDVDAEVDRRHPVDRRAQRLGAQPDHQPRRRARRALQRELARLHPPRGADPRSRFIGGLPMNPATNTLAGGRRPPGAGRAAGACRLTGPRSGRPASSPRPDRG